MPLQAFQQNRHFPRVCQGWVRGQVLNHRFTPLRPVEDSADRRVVLAQVSADFQQSIPIAQMGPADGPASLSRSFSALLRQFLEVQCTNKMI